MKKFNLCGIGNGILDLLVEVDDAFLSRYGVAKSSMRLVDGDFQNELLAAVTTHKPKLASGGSVANSVIAFAQLGGKAAFMCKLADDRYGLHYQEEFRDLKIEVTSPIVVGGRTGTSVILITPDGERTMCTSLGTSELSAEEVDSETIKDSEWIFLEGYLLAGGEEGKSAIRKAVEIAKENDTNIAVTFSDSFIVDSCNDLLHEIVSSADLIFANHLEAQAFTGMNSVKESFHALKSFAPYVIMTAGSEGAFISVDGKESHVSAFNCQPRDLTGAGDMFAGAFLYGLTHGVRVEDSGRGACFLSMKVISHIGARLQSGTKEYWNMAIENNFA